MMKKMIGYTLDLEADYQGMIKNDYYQTFNNREKIDRFCRIIKQNDLKLTVFATGKVLEKYRQMVDKFQRLGSEFELHTYNHHTYGTKLENIKILKEEVNKAKESYFRYFGKNPRGYRAASGVISLKYLKILKNYGFDYDTSIFPSIRPGYFNNFRMNQIPFYFKNENILEIPFGTIPQTRFIISQSYIKFFSFPIYKLLFQIFGLPELIVFDSHLHDFIPTKTRKKLSFSQRFFHLRHLSDSLDYFEKIIEYFKAKGYQSVFIGEIYQKYKGKAL